MATRKVTVTLPEELIAAIGELARSQGIPISRVVAQAAAREVRLEEGRRAVREWQEEHGPFTPEELARARAQSAAADAELMSRVGHRETT